MENVKHKRTSRFPSEETKQKISSKLKGREKSAETRQKLSQSLKAYWGNPQNFPDDKQRHHDYISTGEVV